MKNNMIWFGRYEGWLRWLCKGVQAGDTECIKKAAKLFDLMLPDECIVVPMPGHEGLPKQMAVIAGLCVRSRTRRVYWPILRSNAHESNYLQKKLGVMPDPLEMFLDPCVEKVTGRPVYIIDTVVSSGVTAASALKVLPDATVVTLAR